MRECQEELGIVIHHPTLLSNDIHVSGDAQSLYLVYVSTITSGEPRPLDGTSEVRWFLYEQLQELLFTPKTRGLITRYHTMCRE